MQNQEMQAVNILLEERMPENVIITKEQKEKVEKVKTIDYETYAVREFSKPFDKLKNINKYTIAEYITIIAKIHYELTVLHPFNDGNGRTIRALTNWLLRLKGLCPIYIDSNNRDDYLEALRKIDEENDYELLEIVIIKSIIRTMAELHKSWQ